MSETNLTETKHCVAELHRCRTIERDLTKIVGDDTLCPVEGAGAYIVIRELHVMIRGQEHGIPVQQDRRTNMLTCNVWQTSVIFPTHTSSPKLAKVCNGGSNTD